MVEVNIITDNNGRAKGFAFVTVKELDKGEEIINKLNGYEVMGRKIRVDLSQERNTKNNANTPRKSARELRAMREEGHDNKKRKHPPRRKKD